MTTATTKNTQWPRMMTAPVLAKYLGYSAADFARQLPRLTAAGLPEPDNITGRRDRRKIDKWLDFVGDPSWVVWFGG